MNSDIALVDLLDRLLGQGVVVRGDIVISLAGVDLVQVSLHALITSVFDHPPERSGYESAPTMGYPG
jgi:gas vesicle protein GvpA/GvpJ/GvpM family